MFFVYFDSWLDLKEQRDIFLENNSAIYYKKKYISLQLVESNRLSLAKWSDVFSSLSTMQENVDLDLTANLLEEYVTI